MSLLQQLIDAVALGALYGLVAVGIGLVFGILRLVNFAYGELITIGGYTLAYLSGQPSVVAIVACFAAVIALALVQERVAFRPLRNASPATMLVASFAVSFLLQNIYLLAFGSRGKTVSTLGGLNTALAVGSLRIRWITLAGVRPAHGPILGVRADRVISFSFVISGFLAAAVSVLLTVQSPLVTPDYGVSVTIFALVGVVVGGLDRLVSATLGGFAIGFTTSLVGAQLPSSSSVYLPSVVFGLVILVLILRPAGLFAPARRAVERV